MDLLNFCKSFENFPKDIIKEIGYGADGKVYDFDDKVVKISFSIENDYLNKSKIYNYLKNNEHKCFAKVYDFNFLGIIEQERKYKGIQCDYDYSSYYEVCFSILEKLDKISDDEKKVFHTLLCHEDMNRKKDSSFKNIKSITSSLSKGLEFSEEKVLYFCTQYKTCAVKHNDIHVRNIMKDKFNNFKLIDFDRCFLKGNE